MMQISLMESPFNPWEQLQHYEQHVLIPSFSAQTGAVATFVGTMRDMNAGDEVHSMFLEHYPGMTERQLEGIASDAMSTWELLDLLILHRVGTVQPQEPIVLVAAWSAHRRDAFEACRAVMESLKGRAPFWKQELLSSGEQRWVEENSSGY